MQICEPLETRRLMSGAQLDPSFGNGGIIASALGDGNYRITTTAVQPGGRLLVGGYHTPVGKPGDVPFLLRFSADGKRDSRFAGNATVAQFSRARVSELLVRPDGRLDLVITDNGGGAGGVFGLTVSGKIDSGVKRITAAGPKTALDPQGRLVTGDANSDGLIIRRFNTDGTPDATFGTGGAVQTSLGYTLTTGQEQHQLDLASISVADNGQIYFGAVLFVSQDPTSYHHAIVARLTTGGTIDAGFAGDGVYEFDPGETEDEFSAFPQQVTASSDGGVLVSYRNVDANGIQVYQFSATGTQRKTAATGLSAAPKVFAEPDGGFVLSDSGYVSRFTTSGKYNGTFGHVRIGADSDFRTRSTDGTLYSVSTTFTTKTNGVYTYTLHANRRFIDVGPAANLNVAELTAAPAGSYVFTVQYRDLTGVQRSSFDAADLTLIKTDDTPARVYFVKASTSGNAKVITATYKIAPIGGSWDPSDNGLYAVRLNANQIANVNSGFSDAATLGYFRVSL